MSTTPLAFLTQLEECARGLLPAGRPWRFQRLLNFSECEVTLQLWEGNELRGQAQVRSAERDEVGKSTTGIAGIVQSVGATAQQKNFSFRPTGDEEVERQAKAIAEMWGETLDLSE